MMQDHLQGLPQIIQTYNYLLLSQIYKSCFLQIIPYILMNCLSYFDRSLILQQQLILQQMLIYNQMLKTQFSQAIPNSSIIQKQEELDLSNSQSLKHDDTNPIQRQEQKKKKKQQNQLEKKRIKQPKIESNCYSQPHDLLKKKKVFLSMLDIREAQYKKFKSQNNNDEQNVPTSANVQI